MSYIYMSYIIKTSMANMQQRLTCHIYYNSQSAIITEMLQELL